MWRNSSVTKISKHGTLPTHFLPAAAASQTAAQTVVLSLAAATHWGKNDRWSSGSATGLCVCGLQMMGGIINLHSLDFTVWMVWLHPEILSTCWRKRLHTQVSPGMCEPLGSKSKTKHKCWIMTFSVKRSQLISVSFCTHCSESDQEEEYGKRGEEGTKWNLSHTKSSLPETIMLLITNLSSLQKHHFQVWE